MTFHWAYDEDGNAQPVEKLPSGRILAIGVNGEMPKSAFVHIDDKPIVAPSIDWTADMTEGER
jgi:hypothetical protein